jgi:hypothetical protein
MTIDITTFAIALLVGLCAGTVGTLLAVIVFAPRGRRR